MDFAVSQAIVACCALDSSAVYWHDVLLALDCTDDITVCGLNRLDNHADCNVRTAAGPSRFGRFSKYAPR